MPNTPRTPLCALVLLAAGAWATTASEPPRRERLIPSVDLQVPLAPVPVRIAGQSVLAYELHISNFRPFEVTVAHVEVVDADRGSPVASFDDAELNARLGRPGAPADLADRRRVGAGMRAVVYLWLALDGADPTPARLRHRVEVELHRPAGAERTVVDGGATEVRSDAPVVLDPPLRGGPWVAIYDPAILGGHRTALYALEGRARIPARFAIDWVRLDDDGSHSRGDDSSIANWHGYGADVLAVADATVSAAMDDVAEDPRFPGTSGPPALENSSGNTVSLDLGGGRHAFYEHLKSGSVRVKAGQRVRRGEVIGALGNSGSSSAGPHLHFHVADGSSELGAEGFPFVLRRFEVLGAHAAMDSFLAAERWAPAPPGAGGTRTLELPAANVVVRF